MCFLPDTDQSNHFRHDSQLMHFQDMFELPEMIVTLGQGELIANTSKLLARAADSNWQERMIQASSFFVEPHEQPFGRRFRELCEQIVAGNMGTA
jgi:hypothetical protein